MLSAASDLALRAIATDSSIASSSCFGRSRYCSAADSAFLALDIVNALPASLACRKVSWLSSKAFAHCRILVSSTDS